MRNLGLTEAQNRYQDMQCYIIIIQRCRNLERKIKWYQKGREVEEKSNENRGS